MWLYSTMSESEHVIAVAKSALRSLLRVDLLHFKLSSHRAKRVTAAVRPVQSPLSDPDFACCAPLRRRAPSAEIEPDSFVLLL